MQTQWIQFVMIARNINGTASHQCNCNSWLEHWERFSEQEATTCVALGCTNHAQVGAHVQKVSMGVLDPDDQRWYIIPLCRVHNGLHGQTIDLAGNPTFVSANVANTCG